MTISKMDLFVTWLVILTLDVVCVYFEMISVRNATASVYFGGGSFIFLWMWNNDKSK